MRKQRRSSPSVDPKRGARRIQLTQDTSATTDDRRIHSDQTGVGWQEVGSIIESEIETYPASSDRAYPFAEWITSNWQWVAGIVFSLVVLASYAAWYASAFNSKLSAVDDDVKGLRSNVEAIKGDVTRQGVKVEQIERFIERIGREESNSQQRPTKKP